MPPQMSPDGRQYLDPATNQWLPTPAAPQRRRMSTGKKVLIGAGCWVGVSVALVAAFGGSHDNPGTSAAVAQASTDSPTAEPTAVPTHYCLRKYDGVASYGVEDIVVAREQTDTCLGVVGDLSNLSADLQGYGNVYGTSADTMPSSYTKVCSWAPYTDYRGDDLGGSVWGDVTETPYPTSLAGSETPQGWHAFETTRIAHITVHANQSCASQKPLPAPPPTPACLPRSDAVVQKGC